MTDSDLCADGSWCPDGWSDGSEVYHQDQDGDGMWSGWEYFFDFDPYDASDAAIDSDGDGYINKCENKWNTNPKDPLSFLPKVNFVIIMVNSDNLILWVVDIFMSW